MLNWAHLKAADIINKIIIFVPGENNNWQATQCFGSPQLSFHMDGSLDVVFLDVSVLPILGFICSMLK